MMAIIKNVKYVCNFSVSSPYYLLYNRILKRRSFMSRLYMLLFVIAFICVGCISPFQETIRGNGNIITEERDVGYFTELRITGARSTIVYGDREGPISIITDENLLEYNDTYIENGTLVITTKEDVNLKPTQDIKIEIPGKYIQYVRVSGSNQIKLLDINQDLFTIRGSGSTQLTATGAVDELEVHMSGNSRLKAEGLIAKSITVKTSGSSHAYVYSEESIEARTSGSSIINYYGSPEIINAESSGSSKIREKN